MNLIINENEKEKLFEHVFYFKNAKEIVIVTRDTQNIKTIPSERKLVQWILQNFDIFVENENDLFFELDPSGAEKLLKAKKTEVEKILLEIILKNQFSFLQFVRDPFLTEPKVLRSDNVLKYWSPTIYIPELHVDFSIDDEMRHRVIEDYTEHFPEFLRVIDWIVACRFTERRRSSYLYLRVNAGFGKSFFAAILENLGVGKKINQNQLKQNTAGDLSPDAFRNIFALIIDEFTHFGQDLKDITNSISLTAKFQLAEIVPLYAKIFMSAEKSTSFYGEAGVDAQLSERVNVVDIATRAGQTKLEDRTIYNEVGNALYFTILKQFTHNLITEKVEEYIKLGKIEADRAAYIVLKNMQNNYKIESTSVQKIGEKIQNYLLDFLEWNSQNEKTRNMNFEQLANVVDVKNSNEIIVKDVVKMYEIMLKMGGEQFAKVAKFKQTALDEVLKVSLEKRVYKNENGKTVRGVLVNIHNLFKRDIEIEYINLTKIEEKEAEDLF